MDRSAFTEKIKNQHVRDQDVILRALETAETGKTPENFSRAMERSAILADLGLDADTIAAGLLLDGEAAEELGRGVSLLLEGTAKIGGIQAQNKTVHEAENIRKMLFAMTADIRVIFIKLADKLSALRSADMDVPGGEAKAAAQECLDI
ncbi:MAG: HD domain-containing protein, partial [Treponema sp.]|nr:HD domain-containing protein [Treponema sp.]